MSIDSGPSGSPPEKALPLLPDASASEISRKTGSSHKRRARKQSTSSLRHTRGEQLASSASVIRTLSPAKGRRGCNTQDNGWRAHHNVRQNKVSMQSSDISSSDYSTVTNSEALFSPTSSCSRDYNFPAPVQAFPAKRAMKAPRGESRRAIKKRDLASSHAPIEEETECNTVSPPTQVVDGIDQFPLPPHSRSTSRASTARPRSTQRSQSATRRVSPRGRVNQILVWYCGIFAIPTLFLSLPRSLNPSLSWLSIPAVVSIIVAALVAMVGAGIHPVPGREISVTVDTSFYAAFISITNPVFAYTRHFMFFPLVSVMKNPRDAKKAAWCLQTVATTFYVLFAVVMYVYIGNTVASPAFSSLLVVWAKAARGLALPNLLIAGPLYNHTAAKIIFIRLFRGTVHVHDHMILGWTVWDLLVLLATGAAFVLAIGVPIFGYLIGIAAALFRILVYIRLSRRLLAFRCLPSEGRERRAEAQDVYDHCECADHSRGHIRLRCGTLRYHHRDCGCL